MSDLIITSPRLFLETLETTRKFVPGIKLSVSSAGTNIYFKTAISRIVVKTNSCVADDLCEFSLDDIQKLIAVVSTIEQNENTQQINFKFNGSKLLFNETLCKFALLTSKEDIIATYLDKPIQSQLISICSFNVKSKTVGEILSLISTLFNNSILKIEITQDETKPEMIFVRIKASESSLSNDVYLHLANKISGEFTQSIIIDAERLGFMRYFGIDEVKFSITNNAVLQMDAVKICDKYSSTFSLLTSLLKN